MSHIVTAEDLLSHAVLIQPDGRAAGTTVCGRRRLSDFMRRFSEHRGWPLFLADPRTRCPNCSKLIAKLGNQLAAAQARAVVIAGDD